MKTIAFYAALSCIVASSPIAVAGSFTATGTIANLNTMARTVRLADGDSYRLPADVDLSGLSVGQKVSVTWASQQPNSLDLRRDVTIFELEATDIKTVN